MYYWSHRSILLYITVLALAVLESSKVTGAAIPDFAKPKENTEVTRVVDYYNELLTQLVQLFPEVNDDVMISNYQKRMMGRHGRKRRAPQLYPSLAKELRAELNRRNLLESPPTKRENEIVQPKNDLKSLEKLEKRLDNLEKEFLMDKKDFAIPPTVRDVESEERSSKDSIEQKLERMINGETIPSPRETTHSDDDTEITMQSLKQQLKTTEDELAEILDKLPSEEPNTDDSDDLLKKLSQELASKSKTEGENSPQQQDIKDTTTTTTARTTTTSSTTTESNDRLTQLAAIVKNLIEVNQLAYLQLEDQIRENQSS